MLAQGYPNISYPGGGAFDKPVTFTYDNLGRMLSATDTGGHSATYGYDVIGNVTSQGDAARLDRRRGQCAGDQPL
jgi:YD repeat-containing protein